MILRPRAAAWAGALLLGLAPAAHQSQPVGPQALWDSGHRADALDAWAARLAQQPDDAALRLQLAGRQMEVDRFAAALETAAPLGPEADALRGRALHQLYRYEEALPYLRADDPFEGLLRVDALLALGRSEQADTELEQPVATPEDPAPAEAEPGGERVELETPDETSGEVCPR